MAIVSSAIVEDSSQADRRRWIRERHTDQVGIPHEFAYLCAAAFDAAAAMAARVPVINASLIADEVASNLAQVTTLGANATLTTVYATRGQTEAAIRSAYATAAQATAVTIGDYLATLTDVRLQALFGMSALQVTTLRTSKLTPAANNATSVRASTGA